MIKARAVDNMWLVIILITLNILDFVTTYISLAGGGTEANPIMLYIMEYFNTIWALLYAKALVLSVVLPFFVISVWKPEWLVNHARQGFSDFIGWVLIAVNTLYMYVVCHNLYIIYLINTL